MEQLPQIPTEPTFNPSAGRFNRSAIKKQFLAISAATRQGRFSRVSKEAIDQAEARAETRIRDMMSVNVSSPIGGSVKPVAGLKFLTGAGKQRLVEAFENVIASEMQRIVNDVRTGKTI